MVRKVIAICLCGSLLFALGVGVSAATHSVYDGNFSNTYVQYFKDIISGAKFTDNYVAFRSGEYEYTMVVGELKYENGAFTLVGSGTSYSFVSGIGYNASYTYNVENINNFSLVSTNRIIYSDLGQFPQLVERGAKYEMLSVLLLGIALLGVVVGRFFAPR